MQIIIPMSGIGKRFMDYGYQVPKFLIEIENKKIIEHVISLFPGEQDFIFICNNEDIKNTNIKQILSEACPNHIIRSIKKHKLGPVFAVKQIYDLIHDDKEIIVNYCDFGTYWNYNDFLAHTRNRRADGAVVAYKGFHPHMLKDPNYAFINQSKQWMLDIKEKEPFTDNKMDEYASNGTYYFNKGSLVKKYFDLLIDKDLNVNGEYYVSMVYKLMVEDNLDVSIYSVEHMLQWGTPQDLEDYIKWSNIFVDISKAKKFNEISNCIKIIPAAGNGKRFQDEGYKMPKPFIDVSGYPMVFQAARCLPSCKEAYLILKKEHFESQKSGSEYLKDFKITILDKTTDGQATTCSLPMQEIENKKSCLIASCDNLVLFDQEKLELLINQEDPDCIVFSSKPNNKALMNPEMFGWIYNEENKISEITVKEKLSAKHEDGLVIVGIFYFKTIKLYLEVLKELKDLENKVNNEYYIDSMAQLLVRKKMRVFSFEINKHISLGTPDEYKTFIYWQAFFNKNTSHPYSYENDYFFNYAAVENYLNKEKEFEQEFS